MKFLLYFLLILPNICYSERLITKPDSKVILTPCEDVLNLEIIYKTSNQCFSNIENVEFISRPLPKCYIALKKDNKNVKTKDGINFLIKNGAYLLGFFLPKTNMIVVVENKENLLVKEISHEYYHYLLTKKYNYGDKFHWHDVWKVCSKGVFSKKDLLF